MPRSSARQGLREEQLRAECEAREGAELELEAEREARRRAEAELSSERELRQLAEAKLEAVLASKSWRLTWPLRKGMASLKWLFQLPRGVRDKVGVLPWRLAALRRLATALPSSLVRKLLRGLIAFVNARPGFRRQLASWLDQFPGLKERIRGWVKQGPQVAEWNLERRNEARNGLSGGELSEPAQAVYRRLASARNKQS